MARRPGQMETKIMTRIANFERQCEVRRAYQQRLIAHYQKWGWHSLFPLCSPSADGACRYPHSRAHEQKDTGKVPLVQWKRLVETPPTQQELNGWMRRWPDANLGLALAPTNLVVVDGDSDEALDEVQQLGVPEGPRVSTGGRPKHHYCDRGRLPPGRAIGQGRSGKIDILADGYVVLPPSLHHSGRLYLWGPAPAQGLPPCPGWVAEILGSHPSGAASDRAAHAGEPLPDAPDPDRLSIPDRIRELIRLGPSINPIRYPTRSHAVFAVATSLVRAGYPDDQIAAVLLDARFAISEKPRAQGTRWVRGEVARSRAKVAESKEAPQPRVWKIHLGV